MSPARGKATRWGHYDPQTIDGARGYADGRGLQSLQMLALLAGGMNLTGTTSAAAASWRQAMAELTDGKRHDYLGNLVNLKIETPSDDNFSDDELAFLPFYSLLASCSDPSPCASLFDETSRKALAAALTRTWDFVRPGRSSLWAAIWLSVTGRADKDALESLRWNLQTWQLELIEWPVDNSHRSDVLVEPYSDRFGKKHSQSLHTRSPLPANERQQGRWNANPWDISPAGDGMVEMDPGAWLLPYWLARFHGILLADE